MSYEGFETIQVAVDGPIAVVTVNREKARNALSSQVISELTHIAGELEISADVRTVIVPGAGAKAIDAGADIDTGVRLGLNHPMGPLELSDLIGLDTCLAIAEVLHRELGDDKYRPCPLLRQYVAAGWLGKKVGRGFYEYDAQGQKKA
jgi:hypothetical protein